MKFVPFALLAVHPDGESRVADGGGRLLCFEDVIDFELRPHKVAAFGFVRKHPPEPALDKSF